MKHVPLSKGAKEKLMTYNFPGNVRELKAIMDLAAVMSDGKEIREEDITFSSLKSGELFTAHEKPLRAYTCDIVSFFLKKYNNDVLEVARRLDIGKSTIYNMIRDKEIIIS